MPLLFEICSMQTKLRKNTFSIEAYRIMKITQAIGLSTNLRFICNSGIVQGSANA